MKFTQKIFLITFAIFLVSCEKFYKKPTQNEIVGEYKISNVTTDQVDKNNLNSYHFKLKENGEFEMTKIPILEICEKGKYELDYENEFNELSFQCGNQFSTAHIDSKIRNFAIEFIIEDPGSSESIYFEKVK